MIRLEHITKTYKTADSSVKALDNVSLRIERNSFTAIMGHSGCGKTTLLNILAGYDLPDSGTYWYEGLDVLKFSRQQKLDFLRNQVGFIFQEYCLLPYLNVYDNVALGCYCRKQPADKETIMESIDRLGLKNMVKKFPSQLSGGQKQRVAIARQLARNVMVLLADEPTGALDIATGKAIMDIFRQLQSQGMTVIMVTHDELMAKQADRIIVMENRHVVTERNMASS